MNGDRDFDEGIDIDIIARIFLTEKKFYIFIKLGNNLETLIVNSLINIKKKGLFLINYNFFRSMENKININMMDIIKPK